MDVNGLSQLITAMGAAVGIMADIGPACLAAGNESENVLT